MIERIFLNEVGLRDGLQNQPRILSTEQKVDLFLSLRASGLTHFEATSFVSPKAVPQLADSDAFMRLLPDDPALQLTCLVPNMRGYERARAANVHGIAVVLSATDTLNQKNINMSLEQATLVCEQVIEQAAKDGVFARAYIAVAFACPYEGLTKPRTVFHLTERMIRAGADEIAIADTIGAGNPKQTLELLTPLVNDYGSQKVAAHFHDTRGLGSALAWAALKAGVRRFDSSIAGLGGCPFAPGASGNVATEDLVFLFKEVGFDTGVNFEALLDAVDVASRLMHEKHGGRIMRWSRNQRRGAATVKSNYLKLPAPAGDGRNASE